MAKTPKTPKRQAKAHAINQASRPRRPKQPPLDGMDNPRIADLDQAAEAYADIRDQRIALNREEHQLKEQTLELMHKWKRVIYRHDGIDIRVIHGADDLKVKVTREEDVVTTGDVDDLGNPIAADLDGSVE